MPVGGLVFDSFILPQMRIMFYMLFLCHFAQTDFSDGIKLGFVYFANMPAEVLYCSKYSPSCALPTFRNDVLNAHCGR